MTLGATAKEGKNNNNNNNPVVTNVQCWKGHALVIPKAGNNSRKLDVTNININGRRDGGSSSNIINITSCNTAVDDSIIISDPLRGRGSRRQEVDLVRDLVVTLNSDGDQELPADVTGVSADTWTSRIINNDPTCPDRKSVV